MSKKTNLNKIYKLIQISYSIPTYQIKYIVCTTIGSIRYNSFKSEVNALKD